MKSHTTITRHQEDKQSKATSSLFPIKMIAKQEWTKNNAQENIKQLRNPTMGVTINKDMTYCSECTTRMLHLPKPVKLSISLSLKGSIGPGV